MGGEIIVKISPDGSKVEIDAEGFQGGACEDLMASTMKALGTLQSKVYKPEFYASAGAGLKQGA